jgi:hypothetical protein
VLVVVFQQTFVVNVMSELPQTVAVATIEPQLLQCAKRDHKWDGLGRLQPTAAFESLKWRTKTHKDTDNFLVTYGVNP